MKTKHCTWCGTTKPTTAFCKRHDTIDGLQYGCKECRAELKRLKRKEHWELNREETNEGN